MSSDGHIESLSRFGPYRLDLGQVESFEIGVEQTPVVTVRLAGHTLKVEGRDALLCGGVLAGRCAHGFNVIHHHLGPMVSIGHTFIPVRRVAWKKEEWGAATLIGLPDGLVASVVERGSSITAIETSAGWPDLDTVVQEGTLVAEMILGGMLFEGGSRRELYRRQIEIAAHGLLDNGRKGSGIQLKQIARRMDELARETRGDFYTTGWSLQLVGRGDKVTFEHEFPEGGFFPLTEFDRFLRGCVAHLDGNSTPAILPAQFTSEGSLS